MGTPHDGFTSCGGRRCHPRDIAELSPCRPYLYACMCHRVVPICVHTYTYVRTYMYQWMQASVTETPYLSLSTCVCVCVCPQRMYVYTLYVYTSGCRRRWLKRRTWACPPGPPRGPDDPRWCSTRSLPRRWWCHRCPAARLCPFLDTKKLVGQLIFLCLKKKCACGVTVGQLFGYVLLFFFLAKKKDSPNSQ
jgi:hypothetical protein